MPEYGLAPAEEGTLLPWSWAVERLAANRNYWLATVGGDGRPHVQAVWGLWADDCFWFSTGARSRKARNLAERPACVVTTEHADEPVVVEGVAAVVDAAAVIPRLGPAYRAKYDMGLDPALGPIFRVRPAKVFGLIERADQFSTTATRWTF